MLSENPNWCCRKPVGRKIRSEASWLQQDPIRDLVGLWENFMANHEDYNDEDVDQKTDYKYF